MALFSCPVCLWVWIMYLVYLGQSFKQVGSYATAYFLDQRNNGGSFGVMAKWWVLFFLRFSQKNGRYFHSSNCICGFVKARENGVWWLTILILISSFLIWTFKYSWSLFKVLKFNCKYSLVPIPYLRNGFRIQITYLVYVCRLIKKCKTSRLKMVPKIPAVITYHSRNDVFMTNYLLINVLLLRPMFINIKQNHDFNWNRIVNCCFIQDRINAKG